MAFRNVIIGLVWIATALVYYGIVIALSDQVRILFIGKKIFIKMGLIYGQKSAKIAKRKS